MGSLVLNGATSGSTTLTPTDAVTATLTLPSSTGTILTTGAPQSGGVIQVVQAGSAGGSTSSTSFVDMGLSATITPKFSTSKILIIVNGSYRQNSNQRAGFAIVRASTTVWSGNEICGFANSSTTYNANSYYIQYYDSPASTSSLTYKVQFKTDSAVFLTNDNGGGSANFNFITLMEIAA